MISATPEWLLVTQNCQIADVGAAVGDGHRHIAENSAPIVNRLRAYQRSGQRAGQACLVGEHPHDHTAGVRHDIIATDFDAQVPGPAGSSLHLRSAPVLPVWSLQPTPFSQCECTFHVHDTPNDLPP